MRVDTSLIRAAQTPEQQLLANQQIAAGLEHLSIMLARAITNEGFVSSRSVQAGSLRVDDEIVVKAGTKIYLDGAAKTVYVQETSDNVMILVVNDVEILRLTGSTIVVNEAGADVDFRVEGDTIARLLATDATGTTENVILCANAAPDFQTMDRGVFLGESDTAPTGNPSNGGFIYVDSGALKYRGPGGTTTTVANS